MINSSIFGIAPPKLAYETIDEESPKSVQASPKEKITLFIEEAMEKASDALIKTGTPVRAGQKLTVYPGSKAYAVSPVSGEVESITPFTGIMEKQKTALTIRIGEVQDDGGDADPFEEVAKSPSMQVLLDYLATVPGKPDFSRLADDAEPIKTLLILGADSDLLTVTNQFVIKTAGDAIKNGVNALQKATSKRNINFLMAVPNHLIQVSGTAGVSAKGVSSVFPMAHPEMIALSVVGAEPAGKKDSVVFLSAEAVASIGRAFKDGRIPGDKQITFVGKDGSKKLVTAPVGTHVKDILEKVGATVKDGDRIIFGGPMTGVSIYSIDHPVEPDTDAIILQDKSQIVPSEDLACINCGQCVRVCPTHVPVNELVRYLDAGEYEQAAERAELDACIECGYCTYVCESRIPIFQHIRLAKYALERIKAAEENNA